MDGNTLKVAGVLADSTRFSIYRYITKQNQSVNVAEIAEEFSIHPNVARLHLNKLEEVKLLNSCSVQSGRNGRPSRIYSPSTEEVTLQFPVKNYRTFGMIALDALHTFGKEGREVFYNMARIYGREAALRKLTSDGISFVDELSAEQKIKSITQILEADGISPKIELRDENSVAFSLNSCLFIRCNDQEKNAMICEMHNNIFRGMFETFFSEIELLRDVDKTSEGCCQFFIVLLPIE
jgi:predicted ArsR family transcriptional regulator